MSRPTFGPEKRTLGHPATTRLIDRLWPEEVAERDQRERNHQIVTREIQAYLDRKEATRP